MQFNGPVLELLTDGCACAATRASRRLGPDIVAAAPFDETRFLRRLARATTPRGRLGDALLDQHIVAGIGNFWKSEGLLACAAWIPGGRWPR